MVEFGGAEVVEVMNLGREGGHGESWRGRDGGAVGWHGFEGGMGLEIGFWCMCDENSDLGDAENGGWVKKKKFCVNERFIYILPRAHID